ncbi:MAG: thioredoxin [Nitrososphaerales archaeon]
MAIDAPVHSNEANFNRVLNAGLPVMVVLWRRTCATCEHLNPVLDRLAKTYAGKALVVKVNTDDEAGLARRLNAQQLPGLIFFKDGQEVGRGAGVAPEQNLAAWLDYLAGGSNGARPPAPSGPSVAFGSAQGAAPSSTGYSQPQGTQQAPRGAGTGVKTEPIVLTDANFDQLIRTSTVPVLVDFWAVWCGPCKMIAPHVAALAQEFAGRAVVGKLNVDENARTAGQYGIMSIPTLLIFSGGKVVDQIVGVQPAQVLRQRLARHVR